MNEQYPELVEEAKFILKKCGGLPLAIVTIGGFLAKQPKTPMAWRELNEHISAELEINPELGTIKSVLAKSYDGLPYHLKSCFLYLSIFPEDHAISRRRLVRRWIAEGYSSEVRGMSPEQIADKYFMELIDRSMILPFKKGIHSRKGIDSCHVHDLMHEISISKSLEENLVFRLEDNCSLNMQGRTRHLTVRKNWEGGQSEFESIVNTCNVRSLTVFGKWRHFFISEKMRFLRVLDLEGTSGLVQHHLDHIGILVHLRYFSLKGCRGIYYLPNSLGNLKQLQTLDISGTAGITMLPKTIIKLKNLQYIRAWAKFIYHDGDGLSQILVKDVPNFCAACWAPNKVMQEVIGLSGTYNRRDVCTFCCCVMLPTFARRLSPPGIVMPRGLRELKSLHTMGAVNIAWDKAILQDIRRLTLLRKFVVTGINKKNGQELCSTLANLSNLESVELRSDGEQGLGGYLDDISSPPENLQSIKLCGTLLKLPQWIGKLHNLVKLKLKLSELPEVDATMQVLGSLPKLSILRFLRQSFRVEELRFSFRADAFPSLTMLELDRLHNLNLVEFREGTAPKLEQLLYRDHGDNKGHAGLFSGIPSLPRLKEFLLNSNDDYNEDFLKDVRQQLAKNTSSKPVLKRC